jgi:hypothetical protein
MVQSATTDQKPAAGGSDLAAYKRAAETPLGRSLTRRQLPITTDTHQPNMQNASNTNKRQHESLVSKWSSPRRVSTSSERSPFAAEPLARRQRPNSTPNTPASDRQQEDYMVNLNFKKQQIP